MLRTRKIWALCNWSRRWENTGDKSRLFHEFKLEQTGSNKHRKCALLATN